MFNFKPSFISEITPTKLLFQLLKPLRSINYVEISTRNGHCRAKEQDKTNCKSNLTYQTTG